MESIRDSFGRKFNGLRVSVTQKCNLNCPHCHREGQRKAIIEMSPSEIGEIVSVASSLGASKVKITGGEPLLRDDICDIVSAIRPNIREISMTTNGILLAEFADSLKSAGLDRVNISLHSLSGDNLNLISGKDYLEEVKTGLEAASKASLGPIKLNMVVLRGINDNEIWQMARFSAAHGAILQLIELASDRSGCNSEFFTKHHFSLGELESKLAAESSSISYNELHRRARYALDVDGAQVNVELVRSMHNTSFCANCTRLRLTSDGRLKGCLYENGNSPNMLGALRSGATEEQLRMLFCDAISVRKPYWS